MYHDDRANSFSLLDAKDIWHISNSETVCVFIALERKKRGRWGINSQSNNSFEYRSKSRKPEFAFEANPHNPTACTASAVGKRRCIAYAELTDSEIPRNPAADAHQEDHLV